MVGMFTSASSFNGDLSKWDVSKVTNMDYMFADAASFEQNLCGDAWVHSKASKDDLFAGSYGSISQTTCAPSAQISPRRSKTDRELIVRTSSTIITSTASNSMTCSRCGTFKKSGRVSCCAPGGTWFKNCGSVDNRNVDHRWFEGTQACKRKFKAYDM